MTISMRQDGTPVTARMPTLDELSALIAAGAEKPLSLKKLAKDCILTPPYAELAKVKPACGVSLGIVIAGMSGLVATVTEHGEDDDEIPEDVAAAYVAAQAKGLAALAILRATIADSAGEAVARWFVQSMPTERNCDAYLAAEHNLRAAKTFIEPITVYPARPELDKLQQEAPGLYHVLARRALGRAGLADEIQMGES